MWGSKPHPTPQRGKSPMKHKHSTRRKWETLTPSPPQQLYHNFCTQNSDSPWLQHATPSHFKVLSVPFIPDGTTELAAWQCRKHIQTLWEYQQHRHTAPRQGKAGDTRSSSKEQLCWQRWLLDSSQAVLGHQQTARQCLRPPAPQDTPKLLYTVLGPLLTRKACLCFLTKMCSLAWGTAFFCYPGSSAQDKGDRTENRGQPSEKIQWWGSTGYVICVQSQRCASLTQMSGVSWPDTVQRWLQKQNQATGALVTIRHFNQGRSFIIQNYSAKQKGEEIRISCWKVHLCQPLCVAFRIERKVSRMSLKLNLL